MNITVDWAYLLGGAIGVVGILEYAKGFFKGAPAIAWRLLMPVVCFGVAVAADGGAYQIATNTVLLVAATQIGYEAILGEARRRFGGKS